MDLRTMILLTTFILNIFDVYLLSLIASHYCNSKRIQSNIMMSFCVVAGAVITILNTVIQRGTLSVCLSILTCTIFLLIFYTIDIKNMIITLFLGSAALIICEAAAIIITSQLMRTNISLLVIDDSIQLVTLAYFAQIIKYTAVYFLFRDDKRNIDRKVELNHVLLFFISFLMMINVLVLYNKVLRNEPISNLFVSYFSVCMLIFLVGVFFLHYKLVELLQERERIKLQQDYAEVINSSIEQLETTTHDVSNNLQTLRDNFEEKSLIELINRYQELEYKNSQIKTGFIKNYQLSSLFMMQKIQQANKMGIIFKCDVPVYFDIEMDAVDLFNIISNMLNNAFEAVEKLPYEERYIIFSIYNKPDFCFIEVENSYDGVTVTENKMPLTTKGDKLLHGRGLKSVKKIVEKYHGEFQVDHAEKVFKTLVMLPK